MKKLISAILAVALLLSVGVTGFGATAFSDLDETKYSWAVEQINTMAQKGIINGYPDGTYMPENKVTHNEMLLLIARILGSNNAIYAEHKEDIKALYEEDLAGLALPYPYEVSFLIYKGILSVDEVYEIVEEVGIQQPVKRYEAALYLTKTMNRYDDISDNGSSDTGYADEASIPAYARPFITYVKEEGLMLGMTETTFDPNYDVTRAQAAVLLYRTIDKQNIMFTYGILDSLSSDSVTLESNNGKTSTYDLNANTVIALNGEEVAAKKMRLGEKIILTFQNGMVSRVEMLYQPPEISAIVKGEVTAVNTGATSTISISDQKDGVTKTFKAYNTCEVYVNNSIATLSVVRMKDYATLSLDEDEVVFRIDIMDETQEFTDGVITDIDLQNELMIEIERDNGNVESYLARSEMVIRRNGSEATIQDIVPGDKIARCVTYYGKINRLEVKSEIGSASGRIEEIVISADSSVVIDGKRYPLNNKIKILVDGVEEDVYSLRLDMSAKVTTDSGTITKLEVSKATSETTQLSGTAEVLQISYGYINIKLDNGSIKQISVNSKTTRVSDNATGNTKTLRDIKKGDFLMVVGKSINGTFEAQTIVIAN